ncbi:MAG: xanthine dehydrogenase family protein molybdopterin-binding subunit [Spirochaetota bacterium]
MKKLLVEGLKPQDPKRELSIVGQECDRLDAREKVTGEALYAGDIKLEGMLYGRILHCPHARARILHIDASLAETLPGVRAIITKDNVQDWKTYWYEVPEPALAEVITHEGQEVAAVAAEDQLTAQKALGLIKVEYEVLSPMLDAEAELNKETTSPLEDELYPGRPLIDKKPCRIQRGDIESGFTEADYIIEDTYRTPTQYHATLETRASVASWEHGVLTVWDSNQGVWNSKLALAKSFNLEPECVRVIVNYLGGGFGSKAWTQRNSFFAAKLSMCTGRPVRMERTRSEEFLCHPHRYDCLIQLKMGVKKDGRLTAIYEKAVLNIGAAIKNNYNPNRIIWQTSNLYECPNVDLQQIGVFTNLQLTGPTRAPYNMPGNFPLELHMDKLAEAIGLDPLEFRMKNYKTYASTDVNNRFENPEIHEPWSTKQLDICMRTATEAIGWEHRNLAPIKKPSQKPKMRGIGMAAFVAHQGGGKTPNKAYAYLDIKHDTSVVLHIGIVDIGGGQKTVFSMIAAETLGIPLDRLSVVYGDTENTLYGPSCHTSRVTAEMGPPVLQASAQAKQKLLTLIAPRIGLSPNELDISGGMIFAADEQQPILTFSEACNYIPQKTPLRGYGSREANPDSPIFSSFGAQAAEVEVDGETGVIEVLRITAAQDFGKAINPKLCKSQIVGGIEFGVGYALFEEGQYDRKTGKMLNPNLHQYRVPLVKDMPDIEAFLIESSDPYFAFSARGGAEVTNTPTPAAIMNAVYNATGIWFNKLPVTPKDVITALRNKKDKERASHE